MGMNWKFTVVGGAENGLDVSLPGEASVIVGRSHDVALHISESDVSGRHLEFFRAEGVCRVRNLSRYGARLNGRELAQNVTAPVAAGDAVEIGRHVRIRVDGVPVAEPVETESATSWMEGGFADAPTAVMEESTVTSRGGGAPAGLTASETFSTNLNGFSTRASPVAQPLPCVEDTKTEGAGEEGETHEMETRAGSMEELQERRRELDRRTKFRKSVVLFALVMVSLFLGALWFVSRTGAETNTMEYPKAGGVPDAASYVLRDDDGRALVEVDYPRNPKARVSVLPNTNGISVVSYMGRDRDVPFFLQLEAERRADELGLDLLGSVRAWLERAEKSSAGFVFDARMKDGLQFQFFEDVFPGCCQVQSLYGVKFVTLEYKRTWPDGTPWHGVLIYFRRGDTAFVHRREIPEEFWVRGGYRIRKDPNIAIYANLIDSYWESSSVADLPLDRPTAELVARVRNVLSKERASDWRFLKKDLDAILVKSWREDPRMRKFGEDCLRQFREVLRTYYYGKYNAFLNAKDNRNQKKMNKIRQDCGMVFDDRSERYYFLIGNSEVW